MWKIAACALGFRADQTLFKPSQPLTGLGRREAVTEPSAVAPDAGDAFSNKLSAPDVIPVFLAGVVM